jgi:molybdopterin/thiamine biosynthesis adenylyltransferase/rhodanese-related sulfurtransferase
MTQLTNEEIKRYSRHLTLPKFGMRGQQKLKDGSVLIVGAGGLGSPVGMYLAAAGVGRLGFVEFDIVDVSDLQRQIAHGTSDIGRSKARSMKETIQEINPCVDIELFETRFTRDNAFEIAENFDVIIDGTDNFATRYLVNDVCVLLGKPNVYGAIFRFDGQASVFDASQGPCYRCLFAEPPPPGVAPSCAEGGVLGILPGIIGVIQATEAVKLLLGQGKTLVGRLLLYEALSMSFRELKLQKNPECPLCGENPTITELIDYEEFCGIRGEEIKDPQTRYNEIDAATVASMIEKEADFVLLDVREPVEWEICSLPNSVRIPKGEVRERLEEIDTTKDVIVYCRSGVNSGTIANFLRDVGFDRVWNLRGGIFAWANEIDPTMPVY